MKIIVVEPHKSSLGLGANLVTVIIFAGTLLLSFIPYVRWAAWVVPLVFLIVERNSRFVKFQAATALLIAVIGTLISVLLRVIIYAITPRTYNDFVKLALSGGQGVLDVINVLYTISTIFLFVFAAIYLVLGVIAFLYKQVELPVIGRIAGKASRNEFAGGKMEGPSGGAEKEKPAASRKKTASKEKPVASGTKTTRRQSSKITASGHVCPSCGKAYTSGAKFCGACGAKLG